MFGEPKSNEGVVGEIENNDSHGLESVQKLDKLKESLLTIIKSSKLTEEEKWPFENMVLKTIKAIDGKSFKDSFNNIHKLEELPKFLNDNFTLLAAKLHDFQREKGVNEFENVREALELELKSYKSDAETQG